jgi:hypothetical protein
VVNRGHHPQRTCIGCGAQDDQNRLIRLTANAQGELTIDPAGGGRGGYLHRRRECWEGFVRRKHTRRAFRREISKSAKEKFIRELNEYRE